MDRLMRWLRRTFFVVCLWESAFGQFSQIVSHQVKHVERNLNAYVWHEVSPFPFNELIVSWNALRPLAGLYTFYVRVRGQTWSEWLKYAQWGVNNQQSFSSSKDKVAQVNGCSIVLKDRILATEFEVKIEASGGAGLAQVHKLYASISNTNKYGLSKISSNLKSGFIEHVPQQSQMVLNHNRARAMCSPTATSTVLSYFLEKKVDPVGFASAVYDHGYKIYGNWVLNVAQAYDTSGGRISCCVGRLDGFNALYEYLKCDCPVVVSIQGPIKGGASPYRDGHLMTVIGWDAEKKAVLCIDSAFKDNNLTLVWYDSDEFCKAWGRRKNLSYVFMPL